LILKPIQEGEERERERERDNKASRRKGSIKVGEHKLKPPSSFNPSCPIYNIVRLSNFPSERVTSNISLGRTHFMAKATSKRPSIDPQARMGHSNVARETTKLCEEKDLLK